MRRGCVYIIVGVGVLVALMLVVGVSENCYASADNDGDGMMDGWESNHGLNPNDPSDRDLDNDTDGLTNFEEYRNGTHPQVPDTDNDGMPDGWEVFNGFIPFVDDGDDDGDLDGLNNSEEYNGDPTLCTNPNHPDTDNDSMADGWEKRYDLDPLDNGTIRYKWDNLSRGFISYGTGSEINGPEGDLDQDYLTNIEEYQYDTKPNTNDSDNDGMDDCWEKFNNLWPGSNDAQKDRDKDRLTNLQEYNIGLDPTNLDTDNDGMPDYWEWNYHSQNNSVLDPRDNGTARIEWDYATRNFIIFGPGNPLNGSEADIDGDSLSNYKEYQKSTSPINWDTDSDGMCDGWEVLNSFLMPTYDDSGEDWDADGFTNYEEYMYGHTESGIYWYGLNPNNPDTDNDGMPDRWEHNYGLKPLDNGSGSGIPDHENEYINWDGVWTSADAVNEGSNGDLDGDGLTNLEEYNAGTLPNSTDTDKDGMDDLWEYVFSLIPYFNDSGWDSDNDGIKNLREYEEGTNPNEPDTDDDGLPDIWEINKGLSPLDNGTSEIAWCPQDRGIVQIGPGNPDNGSFGDPDNDFWDLNGNGIIEDNEKLTNVEEYVNGTYPKNPDSDGDGMEDGYEVIFDLTPTFNDANRDLDNDDLTNLFEYNYGTYPNKWDTDGDGMDDAWEVKYDAWVDPLDNGVNWAIHPNGSAKVPNPLNGAEGDPDNESNMNPEGETLTNIEEYNTGSPSTHPGKVDTDGDGMDDAWEVKYGTYFNNNDTWIDKDDDGLTNIFEYNHGTQPNNVDTDGDGYNDNSGRKLGDYLPTIWGNSTLDYYGCPDDDGDGWSNLTDVFINDPTQWNDTDGDGYGDNQTGNNGDEFPNDSTQWNDIDNDGYGDNKTGNYPDHLPTIWGNSTKDYYGCPDDDGDGWSNLTDTFTTDPTQWNDTDGDGHGDNPNGNNPDAFPNDSTQWNDTDGDGYGDNQTGNDPDLFPEDLTQWNDTDGDGYGDNQTGNNPDVFLTDPTQWNDTDSDGYGDNQTGNNPDMFTNDPTQWNDTDSDGYGDNRTGNNPDMFTNDVTQWNDTDSDGYGDNQLGTSPDNFINDPTQWNDTDSDGYGDNPDGNNPDEFPNDATEWQDTDSDTIGDNADDDDDNDGMPDTWEEKYGLNKTDPTDASKDEDGDGVSNLDEFKTDKDPLDPTSKPGTLFDNWWLISVIAVVVAMIVIGMVLSRRKQPPSEETGTHEEISSEPEQTPPQSEP